MVIADDSATIRIVDVESQREVKVIAGADNVRRLGSVGASAHVIAHVQGFDPGQGVLKGPSVVRVLDTETGADVCRWDQANAFAVSADGARVALRFSDQPSIVRVIELASGRIVKELVGGFTEPGVRSEYGFHMRFSPDGSLLVIADRLFDRATAKVTGTLTVFDTEKWSAVQRIDLGRNPVTVHVPLDIRSDRI